MNPGAASAPVGFAGVIEDDGLTRDLDPIHSVLVCDAALNQAGGADADSSPKVLVRRAVGERAVGCSVEAVQLVGTDRAIAQLTIFPQVNAVAIEAADCDAVEDIGVRTGGDIVRRIITR